MKTVSLAQLNKRGWKTGRHFGKALAELVNPGDIVDCTDFDAATNSFVDEFVWRFIENHSASELESIRIKGASPLLIALLKRAKARRIHHVSPKDIIAKRKRFTIFSQDACLL